ncbi:MAG: hypothetical protein KKE17_15265 [Proteobacteria bacterium]|nr:hypothetical protein [Pseudomonadota bacterium]MBU1711359.1 hypothetical protein [Pseudomonadota bacterium]
MKLISVIKAAPYQIKKLIYLVRNDARFRVELRQITLGIIVCFTLFYGGTSLLLDPLKIKVEQKIAQKNETIQRAPAALDSGFSSQFLMLSKSKKTLEEKINILKLQKDYIRENWEKIGDTRRFSDIIFTLLPSAPVHLEGKLNQMELSNPVSEAGFEFQPVILTGSGDFRDIYTYLQYIEQQPEIGDINNINLESMPVSDKYDQAKVSFSITVSRITLKEII